MLTGNPAAESLAANKLAIAPLPTTRMGLRAVKPGESIDRCCAGSFSQPAWLPGNQPILRRASALNERWLGKRVPQCLAGRR